jgi:hypothetical protein
VQPFVSGVEILCCRAESIDEQNAKGQFLANHSVDRVDVLFARQRTAAGRLSAHDGDGVTFAEDNGLSGNSLNSVLTGPANAKRRLAGNQRRVNPQKRCL